MCWRIAAAVRVVSVKALPREKATQIPAPALIRPRSRTASPAARIFWLMDPKVMVTPNKLLIAVSIPGPNRLIHG
jgi:hypothetical protein